MIEYLEQGHIYLDSYGIIIPGVSNLVNYALDADYSNIPRYILDNACKFGTEIHLAIEKFLTSKVMTNFEEPYRMLCFNEFLKLYKEVIDNPICEMMVDYNERYAGRIDCLSDGILIDFKTNTEINIPHLEYQLSFYAMALESKGIKVNKLMCLWLPKRKSGRWVEINRISNNELLEILKEYEDNNAN